MRSLKETIKGGIVGVLSAGATSAAINTTQILADLDSVVLILGGIVLVVGATIGLIITLTIVSMVKGILLGIRDGVVRSMRF